MLEDALGDLEGGRELDVEGAALRDADAILEDGIRNINLGVETRIDSSSFHRLSTIKHDIVHLQLGLEDLQEPAIQLLPLFPREHERLVLEQRL